MDRAEGALLVAERALGEARSAACRIDQIATATPRGATSFLVNEAGELVVVHADGSTTVAGSVRGADGAPGAAINEAAIDEAGNLVLRLSDGRAINAGPARGEPGAPGRDAPPIPGPAGRSIVSGAVDERGHLLLRFTDGIQEDVGLVVVKGDRGERGETGERGASGPLGRGVESAKIIGEKLEITYSDGAKETVGRVVGRDGKDGKDGRDGKDGAPGRAGRDGKDGPQGEPGTAIELGDVSAAGLSARDLGRVTARDIVIDGQITRVLTLD